jgi:hypothetical protein
VAAVATATRLAATDLTAALALTTAVAAFFHTTFGAFVHLFAGRRVALVPDLRVVVGYRVTRHYAEDAAELGETRAVDIRSAAALSRRRDPDGKKRHDKRGNQRPYTHTNLQNW